MKKLITSILLAITLNLSSQEFLIYYVQPAKVCQGDTLHVYLVWDNNHRYSSALFLTLVSVSNPTTTVTYMKPTILLSHLPKTMIGTDTIYHLKVRIPLSFPLGQATISPDLVTRTPLDIIECVTGIREEELNGVEPIYYDFYGNRIEKRKGEMIIEQRGRYRVKVLYE